MILAGGTLWRTTRCGLGSSAGTLSRYVVADLLDVTVVLTAVFTSAQAHHRARYEPKLGDVIGEIHTVADIKVKYGNLTKYEGSLF